MGEPINPEAWLWYRDVVGNKQCPVVDTYWQTETVRKMLGFRENVLDRGGIVLGLWLKGDRREVGFQDGGCFSRFLKRERINNQTFKTFLKLT